MQFSGRVKNEKKNLKIGYMQIDLLISEFRIYASLTLRFAYKRVFVYMQLGYMQAILPVPSTCIYPSSTVLANLGQRGELLTKQMSFLAQPYARLVRIALQNFASLFSPTTVLLASLHETHVRARHQAIFKRYASEPTHGKLNRDKMAHMIAAGAHSVSNSRL